MRPELLPAIDALKGEVATLEVKLAEAKSMTNRMCDLAGISHAYADVGTPEHGSVGVTIRADQFYGKVMTTAAREYLETRKASGLGPAAPREVFDALTQGGFQFDTRNEANAITGVRAVLRKNSSIFHRLPNNQYGLLVWYPNAKANKADDYDSDDARKPKASRPRSKPTAKRRVSTGKPPKAAKRSSNQALTAFVLAALEDGTEWNLAKIKREAIALGNVGVDARTPSNKLQGTMLSLMKQGRVQSLGSGMWKISKAESPPQPFGAEIHAFKGAA
jgi:hypothetical protein